MEQIHAYIWHLHWLTKCDTSYNYLILFHTPMSLHGDEWAKYCSCSLPSRSVRERCPLIGKKHAERPRSWFASALSVAKNSQVPWGTPQCLELESGIDYQLFLSYSYVGSEYINRGKSCLLTCVRFAYSGYSPAFDRTIAIQDDIYLAFLTG